MDLGKNRGVHNHSEDSNFIIFSKQDTRYRSRKEILWHLVDPHLIARLYGLTLQGLEGEDAKEFLKDMKAR